MKKYTSGLTEDELNDILNQAGQVDDNDNTRVTVDGHIWQIDRDKLEIVDYLGEDDGIEIRYTIEGNDDYIIGTPNITVKVTVRNNKGTLDVSTIKITKNGAPLTGIAINNNGEFELVVTETEGATFTVSAQNSKGEQSTPRTINVIPKRDTTKPSLSGQTAIASGMDITIKANAADNESGLKSLTYTVSPATVEGGATGTLSSGVEKKIKTTALGNYTITFTATDNANNSTTATAGPVTTSDVISIAELKSKINASNYPDYLGTKVDYNPKAGGTWRVFYYDASGEFGDGEGTIYLRGDYRHSMSLYDYTSYTPADGGALMRQLNPLWAATINGMEIDDPNDHCASYLCDSSKWTIYKTAEAKYAIGAAPIEMWCKAQNAYKNKYDTSASTVRCRIGNKYGYGYTINGGSLVSNQATTVVNTSIEQSKVITTGKDEWLASPSSGDAGNLCIVSSSKVNSMAFSNSYGYRPVVSLNH